VGGKKPGSTDPCRDFSSLSEEKGKPRAVSSLAPLLKNFRKTDRFSPAARSIPALPYRSLKAISLHSIFFSPAIWEFKIGFLGSFLEGREIEADGPAQLKPGGGGGGTVRKN